ncbi:MAG: type II toxin-antitoxin system RelE/ParE family toxin [Propionibacteriaceae bacterium]|nr:type II toxin-antitoxin system RelE/ParE family toxin [Propionibacteriaceae bacterium]
MAWRVEMVGEVQEWLNSLDQTTRVSILAAVVVLGEEGPSLGRPLVDSVKGSTYANMKELRPPSSGRQTIRVLFAFDPRRQAILLVGGDKTDNWDKWYRRNIPVADERFERHVKNIQEEGR